MILIAAEAWFWAPPARAAFEQGTGICETTTTTGTGTVNLAGAYTSGTPDFVSFVSQITSGSTVPYTIESSDGKFEHGQGVFTDASPDTLTRVAFWSTDGSGAELTLPAGTHIVCLQTGEEIWSDGIFTPTFADINGYSSSAGAVGPRLKLWHDSATPAADDNNAFISFNGEDDGSNETTYAGIDSYIIDPTNGSEDGMLVLGARSGGSFLEALTISGTGITGLGGWLDTVLIDVGTGSFPVVQIMSEQDDNTGPFLLFYHNSTTPAASDALGGFAFFGKDDSGTPLTYAYIQTEISDPTNGNEGGRMIFAINQAASSPVALQLGDVGYMRWFEDASTGQNYVEVIAPSTLGADRSCTLQDDATPFDNCVTPSAGGYISPMASLGGAI